MSWDRDSVEHAGNIVGRNGALWVLYLAQSTEVGRWKTSDYHTQKSSVKSYAKSQSLAELSDPVIREGYDNISSKEVVDADYNREVINDRDRKEKSVMILSLTQLGKNLVKTVDSDPEIRNSLKNQIGIPVGRVQPWWPGEGDPDQSSHVYMRTFADRSVLDEEQCEIEVIASFACFRCNNEIEDHYQVELEDGNFVSAWDTNIRTECSNCEEKYKYTSVSPFRKPRSIDD